MQQKNTPAGHRRRKFNGTAVLFVAPALILFIIFIVQPAATSIYYSLTNYNILRPDKIEFIGLGNFITLIQDDVFYQALWNTLYFTAVVVPYQCTLALCLALLVRDTVRGVGIFRAAFFSPMVTSMTVISILWVILYNPDPNQGLINAFLGALGLGPVAFLRDPDTAMNSIIFMSGWQAAGYQMMIFLAGLLNIPEERYEAAAIDGANRWQSFWHITMPGLANTTKYVVMITTIQAMKLFTQPYIMTQGGPQNATKTLVYYIYQQGFQSRNVGYASAVAVVFFVIVVALSLLLKRVIDPGKGGAKR